VRQDHAGAIVRLSRLEVGTEPGDNGGAAVREGQVVGVRAAPSAVRVLGKAK
jgi:hypothetical protein